MLQTRKSRVIFVTPTTSYEINLTRDQLLAGMEIEEHIVADVVCFGFNVHCLSILFDISVHSKRSHVASFKPLPFISMSSLICYCFFSFTGTKSRRFHGRNTSTMTYSSQKTVASRLQSDDATFLPIAESWS